MANDKLLLDEKIKDYYNSIQEQFFNRIKYDSKFDFSTLIQLLSLYILMLSLLPTQQSRLHDFYCLIITFINNTFKISISHNFWDVWSFGIIISFLIFLLIFVINKKKKKNILNKVIRSEYLNFCYTFLIRKEINNYLINERSQHLEKCEKFIKKIIKRHSLFTINDMNIVILYDNIIKQFNWFKITSQTTETINAIASLEKKILNRIRAKSDIESLKNIFDYLTLYEFSLIKPNELTSEGKPLGEKKDVYFYLFSVELNKLNDVILEIKNNLSIKSMVSKWFSVISLSLRSNNLFISFISWILLLLVVFLTISFMLMTATNIKFDSTIMVGIITVPFIGAITFATAIYTRHGK